MTDYFKLSRAELRELAETDPEAADFQAKQTVLSFLSLPDHMIHACGTTRKALESRV